MGEVTLALLLAFGGALAGLTAGGTVGVMGVNGVNSALGDGVVVLSDFLSSLEAGSCTLQGTLHRLQVGAGGETGTAVSGTDDGGENGLHWFKRRVCLKDFGGSADGADHHVEVGSSLSGQCVAIALGYRHLALLTSGVGGVGTGGSLHDGHSAGSGAGGHTQGCVGLAQT